MNYSERALTFDCLDDTLVGVLAAPSEPQETAVLIIVGGPQYRAGSHRQFVLLARHLAESGFATLRFDYRGMGDSTGPQRSFESISDDIGAAIDALMTHAPTTRRVVLWGLCDGASAALLYCGERADSRIAGLCLVNPWVRSEASLARTHVKHYYMQRLAQPEFWVKLFRGQIGSSALRGAARNVTLARDRAVTSGAFHERMGAAWTNFPGQLHLVLSGNDYTAKEFLEHAQTSLAWWGALAHPNLRHDDIVDADHTFSASTAQALLEQRTRECLVDHTRAQVACKCAMN